MNHRAPYRYAFAAIVLSLATACSVKVNVNDSAAEALQSAMAADKAFSDYAQSAPMAEAFAKYMDAVDGKMIGPGEVTKGEAAIRAAFKDWPADLKMTWSPDTGHAAKSGDLAVTSGRWTRTRNGSTVAQGRYVTVWRRATYDKAGNGDWKGVIDIGAPDPAPQPTREPDPEGRPG